MPKNWLSGFCPSTVVRILATQQKQINKLTLRIDIFTFYTQICLCHLLAISTHLFTHWAAGTFFNLRPFRFRDKAIVSSADSDTSHVGRFRGCMWTAGAHIPEFPPTNRKNMPLRKSTFKGRTYIPIEHGDFPASIFGNVYIWVVAVTTREAYNCSMWESQEQPEWSWMGSIRRYIYLTIPDRWWLNQPSWKICPRQIGANLPRDRGEN